MKFAHEYFNGTGSAMAGFNRRISGELYHEAFQYPSERYDRELNAGWNLADRMINDGRIYSVHLGFHHTHSDCKGYAFHYGGSIVCNECQRSGVDKPWWVIKVYLDGNAWCCVGEEFENLQESDCYAFGDTREEAMQNYGNLYYKPAETGHEAD